VKTPAAPASPTEQREPSPETKPNTSEPPAPSQPELSIPAGGTEWLKTKPSSSPAPFPVVASSDSTAEPTSPRIAERGKPPAPKPIPHIRARSEIPQSAAESTEARPGRDISKKLVSVLAVVVIAAGGFFVFKAFRKNPPPPSPSPSVATSPAPTKATPVATTPASKPGPTPSETLNPLAATPARAIEKAKAVISASESADKKKMDELLGSSASEKPTQPISPPASQPLPQSAVSATPTPSTSAVAPSVPTNRKPDTVAEPSPAFRSWVADARISGIFEGTPPRALINGRMVRGGQVVEETLAITFDHIDAKTKMIVFRDQTGATVSRKF
jgi:hypothetical protein